MVKLDLDEYSDTRYKKMLQYAILCYQEMDLLILPSIDVVELEMNDVNVVALPEDYEYYTKIGLKYGDQILTLSVDNKIALQRDKGFQGAQLNCEGDSQDVSTVLQNGYCNGDWFPYSYYYSPYYRAGNYVGEQYSVGGRNRSGYFRIDENLRTINFSNVPRTTVIMEYKSTKSLNGQTPVDRLAAEVIRYYIHWQLRLHDRSSTQQEIQRYYQLYINKFEVFSDAEHSFTMMELLDTLWEGYSSTPKR